MRPRRCWPRRPRSGSRWSSRSSARPDASRGRPASTGRRRSRTPRGWRSGWRAARRASPAGATTGGTARRPSGPGRRSRGSHRLSGTCAVSTAAGRCARSASRLLAAALRPLYSNAPAGAVRPFEGAGASLGHTVLDLGADLFTVGRLHPMLDVALRNRRLAQEAGDPEAAVLLLDVVLGEGVHPDPAGAMAPAIAAARDRGGRRRTASRGGRVRLRDRRGSAAAGRAGQAARGRRGAGRGQQRPRGGPRRDDRVARHATVSAVVVRRRRARARGGRR